MIRGIDVAAVMLIMSVATPAMADNLIVPGQRVGPIRLGMTKQQLYSAMGEPEHVAPLPNFQIYDFETRSGSGALHVSCQNGRVISIQVWNLPNYSTKEGLKCGDSILARRAKLGEPRAKRAIGTRSYQYAGIEFLFSDAGRIVDIIIRL